MPLYEYGCDACGHRLEVQQKLADAPLKTCPTCGKDALARLISATSFVLKGGGWYKDGYSGSANKRTENQRGDRVEKAINDDKKKTAAAESTASSGGGTASSSDSGGGGSGSTGSSGQSGSAGSSGSGSGEGGSSTKTAASS